MHLLPVVKAEALDGERTRVTSVHAFCSGSATTASRPRSVRVGRWHITHV